LFKPALLGVRAILIVAAVLVAVAGFQLFVLTEHTDRYFAWTIASPITAAFLGAAYWASLPMLLYGCRQSAWANVRTCFFSPLIFTTAVTAATLQHLNVFHFGSQYGSSAVFAAWAWLAVYVLVPVAEIVLLIQQLRVKGTDPPRQATIPGALRVVIGVQGIIMALIGLMLFVAPAVTAPLWPWKLTPLTAQVVGGWLLGLAVADIEAIYENDWRRVAGPVVSYTAFGFLQLIAIGRYPASLAWGGPGAIVYVSFMASIALVGSFAMFSAIPMWRKRTQ
jgi:hypothetical protein